MIFLLFKKVEVIEKTLLQNKNINIKRVQDLILVDIKATGFLYGMVRLIVGQLVLVGEKNITRNFYR